MGFQLSRLSFRLRTTVNGHSARVYTTVGAGGGGREEGRERGKEVHLWERCCFVSFRRIVARTRGEKSWKDGGERKFIGQVETRLIVPSFFFFSLFSLLIVSFPPDRCAPRSFCVILFCFSLCRQSRAEETSVEHEGKNGGGSRKRPLCLVKRERKIFRARFVRVKPLP